MGPRCGLGLIRRRKTWRTSDAKLSQTSFPRSLITTLTRTSTSRRCTTHLTSPEGPNVSTWSNGSGRMKPRASAPIPGNRQTAARADATTPL